MQNIREENINPEMIPMSVLNVQPGGEQQVDEPEIDEEIVESIIDAEIGANPVPHGESQVNEELASAEIAISGGVTKHSNTSCFRDGYTFFKKHSCAFFAYFGMFCVSIMIGFFVSSCPIKPLVMNHCDDIDDEQLYKTPF